MCVLGKKSELECTEEQFIKKQETLFKRWSHKKKSTHVPEILYKEHAVIG